MILTKMLRQLWFSDLFGGLARDLSYLQETLPALAVQMVAQLRIRQTTSQMKAIGLSSKDILKERGKK